MDRTTACVASLSLGLDLGTSGCRGILIDGAGRLLAMATEPLPPPAVDGPCVEQDPALWWQAVLDVLRTLVDRSGNPAAIGAMAVDGTSATLLLCDPAGEPLGPALMYNDSRARAEARRIAALAPRDSGAHGATGSLAKLLYGLARFPGAARALHQAEWIGGRLAGRFGWCDENNALKLGYDPAARRWPAWLPSLGVPPHLLPAPVPPGTPVGTIAPRLAATLGLAPGTLVVAGTTDSVAAFIATGAEIPGEAVTSLGSTLVLKVLSGQPVFAPEFGVYSHRLGDRWLVGGASNSGGAALLTVFHRREMAALMPRLEPDRPTGLDYYPLPRPGERFPVSDPDLAPRMEPRPADRARYFQGLLEGIASIEARGYHLLAELGAPYPTSVRSVGGGAVNAAWSRIRARHLGVPVLGAAHQDAAYGAALLARRGLTRAGGRDPAAASRDPGGTPERLDEGSPGR